MSTNTIPSGGSNPPLVRPPSARIMVQVAREQGLDIIHAHYAVPHATAAYLAKQILVRQSTGSVPKIITTLHGTDITLVGSDHSYAETVSFSIDMWSRCASFRASISLCAFYAFCFRQSSFS